MTTVTKKELVDKIADATGQKRSDVKVIVQTFFDHIISELTRGNRFEFSDFGVFEVKHLKARKAQNPKTLAPVMVHRKRTVRFKAGRTMKNTLLSCGKRRRV